MKIVKVCLVCEGERVLPFANEIKNNDDGEERSGKENVPRRLVRSVRDRNDYKIICFSRQYLKFFLKSAA